MIDSINGYTPISQNSSTISSKIESTENSELFKQLLNKAVQGKVEHTQTIDRSLEELGASALGTVQKNRSGELLSKISSINDININNPIAKVESRAEELIDKLNLYTSELENPKFSLKDIDSLMNEINQSAGSLLKDAEDLGGNTDKELMDIVRECTIVAQSEYIKLYRGDYLDSSV
ncbi:MAG: hypothetical protein HQK63_14045 [Desulfamplus sp.]|nr:hypothetical protein [Desulfamplus sp.]